MDQLLQLPSWLWPTIQFVGGGMILGYAANLTTPMVRAAGLKAFRSIYTTRLVLAAMRVADIEMWTARPASAVGQMVASYAFVGASTTISATVGFLSSDLSIELGFFMGLLTAFGLASLINAGRAWDTLKEPKRLHMRALGRLKALDRQGNAEIMLNIVRRDRELPELPEPKPWT